MSFFRVLRSSVLVLAITMLQSCSSGGGGGEGAVSGRVQLSGTVAAEKGIGTTSIAFRDSTGKIAFVSTGPTGTFDAALGLTLPVISRAPNPGTGKFMYSYASAEGTSNIHPLTDPILRIWFKAKGLSGNIDNDFISTTPFPLPTADEIAFIKAVLQTIVSDFLRAVGLNPASFDLITSPFSTDGSGFDNILKGTRINATNTGAVNISVVPFTDLDSAVTGSGFSSTAFLDSSIISLATDTTPPAPPSGLAAASLCGGNEVKALVTWSISTSSDVASYQVFEETRGHMATVTYTAFIVPNLSTMTSYTFSTKAVDAAGNVSASSNASAVTIGPCSLPPIRPNALSSAPTLAALSSSQLRLDWTDSQNNILEYRVYRAGPPNVLLARTAGAIGKTFTDFQLVPETKYCYIVTLVGMTSLESDPSPQVCGFTLPGVPPAPTNVTAAKSGAGQITVSWDAVGNATSYRLYRATQAGLTKANYATLSGGMLTSGITNTSANVTSLAIGTTYYLMMTAVNGSGDESVESIEVSGTP